MRDEVTAFENMVEEIVKSDKLFTLGAKMIRKSIDALIAEGLSREEAVKIISVQGSVVKRN